MPGKSRPFLASRFLSPQPVTSSIALGTQPAGPLLCCVPVVVPPLGWALDMWLQGQLGTGEGSVWPRVGRVRFPDTGPHGSSQSWAVPTASCPLKTFFYNKKQDCFFPYVSRTRADIPSVHTCVLEGRSVLGGRTNGGPTSLWGCTGSSALKEPVVGLFQGIWGVVMRGGSLLKLSCLFPLLSLKGTQSYPTRPRGQPRLEVHRATPWGVGEGAKPGEQQTLENMPRDKEMPLLFFHHPQTPSLLGSFHLRLSVCPSVRASLWVRPLAVSGPRPVGRRGFLGASRSWGRGRTALSETSRAKVAGTGLCYV